MERKDLKKYSSKHIHRVENNRVYNDPCFWSTFYIHHDADAVMDAQEAKIKEMGERILERNKTVCEQTARIKELEAKINVLEKQAEVTDRMLQDMANNSNKEFLPDSNKELGTQLGTDHLPQAGKMMWVSVNDRLPEFGQSVLVIDYSPDNNDGCFIAWRNKTSYGWEWHLMEGITTDWDFFTHWMPLPPPPAEENTETEKEDK